MVHNQIHVPLSQILKACPFREYHAQHSAGIFHAEQGMILPQAFVFLQNFYCDLYGIWYNY